MRREHLIDTSTDLVVPLAEALDRTASEVGGKAANLAILRNAGFQVPEGFVITTEAFVRFVAANGFAAGASADEVRAGRVPDDVASQLGRVPETLGGLLAVRSSGVSEDLEGSSYAGQYESVLGVEGEAQIKAALLNSWASTFEDHLLRYHGGSGEVPQMAVLIQQLVQAETAGVAFSVNPVTGDSEVVINAVPGLGDRLMAGEIDGEQWTVRAGIAERSDGQVRALSQDQAIRVATLAGDIERHFGSPQDIEWAFAGEGLYVLQARPITTLPIRQAESPVDIPDGYWQREASHSPHPWSPFTASITYEIRNPTLRRIMAEFGALIDGIEFREIGGWEYVRTVPLGGKDRPAPPAWLMPIVIRLVPAMRARIRQAVASVRSDRAGALVDRWHREWLPDLKTRIISTRSVDLSDLSDEALGEHYASTLSLLRDGGEVHFTLHVATCMALAELMLASTELLGWEESRVWDLVAGLSTKSTEPSRGLGALAEMAATKTKTRRIIEEGTDALSRLRREDPDFVRTFDSYLGEYGGRVLDYDIATPSLAEDPELALRLVADQLARGPEVGDPGALIAEARTAAIDGARATLNAMPGTERERWERALTRAQRSYPVREENVFYTLGVPMALVRYAVLAIGARLAERSQLAFEKDVFFLHHDELVVALTDGQDRKDLVLSRQAERAWFAAHPGPAAYGKDPGPPPTLDALPPEARFINQALLWYAKSVFDMEQSNRAPGGPDVLGTAASPGRYQGPARVIRTEAEFHKLRIGDVLVCPMTTPVWSVLFPSIGALVTDTGGVLSHPAIIAREYRVPAVVATGNATQRIHDGQIITVDGVTGVVYTTATTPPPH